MNKTGLKQYFTPPVVAGFMADNSCVDESISIVDPSSGEGVFLEALKGRAFQRFVAVDVDNEALQRINRAKGYPVETIAGDGLDPESAGGRLPDGAFDLTLGNPPFSGQKDKIRKKSILNAFSLGRKQQAQEVLFLEKSVRLLKPGGSLRIILPASIFANTGLKYVRRFILDNLTLEALVELPPGIFPDTPAKTAILFATKSRPDKSSPVRLISVESEKDLIDLKLCRTDKGILIMPEDLEDRMDPSFHILQEKARKIIAGSDVQFLPLCQTARIRTGFCRYGSFSGHIALDAGSFENPLLLLRARNISPFGIKSSPPPGYIEKGGPLYRQNALVLPGHLCFVRVGAGCIGRTLLSRPSMPLMQADDWCFIIEPRGINPFYLNFYLNSSPGRFFVKSLMHGTGTISISKNRLSTLPVAMADELLQRRIAASMEKICDAFITEEKSRATELFEKLDGKFSGELKIDIS